MPSEKAVLDVIAAWSGDRPTKLTQSLEEWWNLTATGSPHSAIPFKDGVLDLIQRLQKAFPNSPKLQQADFLDAGTVKTVQDLVDALQPPISAAIRRSPKAVAGTASPKTGATKPVVKSPAAKKSPSKRRNAKKGKNR